MIRTRKFDVLCSWNFKRQMTRSLHAHRNIVSSVDNQRAGVNRSKEMPYIVFRFHPLRGTIEKEFAEDIAAANHCR
jgi:hypothetical protein